MKVMFLVLDSSRKVECSGVTSEMCRSYASNDGKIVYWCGFSVSKLGCMKNKGSANLRFCRGSAKVQQKVGFFRRSAFLKRRVKLLKFNSFCNFTCFNLRL